MQEMSRPTTETVHAERLWNMRSHEKPKDFAPILSETRRHLRGFYDAAVAAADPMLCIAPCLPPRPEGRVIVVGAGKASARMAEAVEAAWGPCEGLVLTRDGHARATRGIEVVEASHPIPDVRGLAATARLFDLLGGCAPEDFVLALISGGGSSLLTRPAGAITLAEEQAITRALLASGAPIDAMNTIRKHLSSAKGGAMAAACAGRMLSFIISDVPGDDPAAIASGPTVGDVTTAAEARRLVDRWAIPLTPAMEAVLSGPPLTFPPHSLALSRVENRMIAAPSRSLDAARRLAVAAGCTVDILGDAVEGEARVVARDHAQRAMAIRKRMRPGDAPILLLSGGECTVTQRGTGIGGPNAEYALALALALGETNGVSAIACDTDGVDGAADVAGALIDETTLVRARAADLDPFAALANNDSHSFFATLGDQVVTGPTLTNVNDFRAILIADPARRNSTDGAQIVVTV